MNTSPRQIAKWLGAPVALVLDCWAMARSAAAVVKGFSEFDPDLDLGGVVFNRVGGKAHAAWLADALDAAGLRARVLGGVRKVGARARAVSQVALPFVVLPLSFCWC